MQEQIDPPEVLLRKEDFGGCFHPLRRETGGSEVVTATSQTPSKRMFEKY